MRNIKKLRDQKGFTLVEIAIILTIVGLVIGGIWIAASTVYNNKKKTDLAEDTLVIVQNLRNLYAGQSSTAGLTDIIAANAGVFPSDLIIDKAAGDVRNSFNSAANGTAVTPGTGTTPTTFIITYTLIPKDACVELLSGRLAQSDEAIARIGLSAVSVGGAALGTLPGGITPAEADAGCGAANIVATLALTFSM